MKKTIPSKLFLLLICVFTLCILCFGVTTNAEKAYAEVTYTVDFTYNNATVKVDGDTKNYDMNSVFTELTIREEIIDIQVFDANAKQFDNDIVKNSKGDILFDITKNGNKWILNIYHPFLDEFTLNAYSANTVYRLSVTDPTALPSNGYTISYETNDGSTVADLTNQTKIVFPAENPTKEDNIFDGWYTDSTLKTKATAGTSISANTTLYAKWKIDTTRLIANIQEDIGVNDVNYSAIQDDLEYFEIDTSAYTTWLSKANDYLAHLDDPTQEYYNEALQFSSDNTMFITLGTDWPLVIAEYHDAIMDVCGNLNDVYTSAFWDFYSNIIDSNGSDELNAVFLPTALERISSFESDYVEYKDLFAADFPAKMNTGSFSGDCNKANGICDAMEGEHYEILDSVSVVTVSTDENSKAVVNGVLDIDNQEENNITVDDDFTVTVVASFNTGYKLNQFLSDTTNTSDADNTFSTTVSSKTVFIKVFGKIAGYTITYETNEGSAIADLKGQTKIVFPETNPTKDGFYFAGWFTDSTLKTNATAGTSISANTTLYANWTKVIVTEPTKDNDYTVVVEESLTDVSYQWYKNTPVTIDIKDATEVELVVGTYNANDNTYTTVSYFSLCQAITFKAKTGVNVRYTDLYVQYTYNGTEYTVQGTENFSKGNPALAITFAGDSPITVSNVKLLQYTKRALSTETNAKLGSATLEGVTYSCAVIKDSKNIAFSDTLIPNKVTFDGNGATGTAPASIYQLEGRTITLPTSSLTKTDYKFVGWNTDKTATTKLDSYTTGNGNVTLYAIWKEVYSLYYETFGGTQYSSLVYPTITFPYTNPVKDNVTFEGWYLDTEFREKAVEGTVITKSTTLYARFLNVITEEPTKSNDYSVKIDTSLKNVTYQWYESNTMDADVWKTEKANLYYSGAEYQSMTETDDGKVYEAAESSMSMPSFNVYVYAVRINCLEKGDIVTFAIDASNIGILNGEYSSGYTYSIKNNVCTLIAENSGYIIIAKESRTSYDDAKFSLTDIRIKSVKVLADETNAKLGSSTLGDTGYYCVVTLENGESEVSRSVSTHKISFDGNGATGTAPASIYQLEGRSITLPENTFTKTGSAFQGYHTDKTATTALSSYTTGNGDAILYAIWKNIEYDKDITFTVSELQYDVQSSSISVTVDDDDLTVTGMKLWFDGKEVDVITKPGLYTMYVIVQNKDDDVYFSNNIDLFQNRYAGNIDVLGNTLYWNPLEMVFPLSWGVRSCDITADTEFFGGESDHTEQNTVLGNRFYFYLDGYAITYDDNVEDSSVSDMPTDSNTYLEDTPLTISSAIPTRTGYQFMGWSFRQNGEVISGTDKITEDVTLYAVWHEKTAVVLAESAQTYTFNGQAQRFALQGTHKAIGNFLIRYYTGDTWSATAPTDVGSYNVKIERAEDSVYKAYAKEIADGLVIEKANAVISVDQTTIEKTYGEVFVLPTASSTFGVVSCDKESTDCLAAGTYTVTYTVDGTENYYGDRKTVNVIIDKLAVNEPIVVGTYKYTGDAQTVLLTGVESYMTTSDSLSQTDAGAYTITYVLDDNHSWTNDSDGTVLWEIKALAIQPETQDAGENPQVTVSLDDGFTSDITVTVEVTVEADLEATLLSVDYYNLENGTVQLQSHEKVGVVFDVKLLQTINGEQKEIQPSDIQEGAVIKVQMLIPDSIDTAKVTRILHVHSANDIEEIEFDASKIVDGYYEVEIDRLSEFAFIYKTEEPCIIHRFLLGLLLALLIFTAVLWFALKIRSFRTETTKVRITPIVGFSLHFTGLVVLSILSKCLICLSLAIVNATVLVALILLYVLYKPKKSVS